MSAVCDGHAEFCGAHHENHEKLSFTKKAIVFVWSTITRLARY